MKKSSDLKLIIFFTALTFLLTFGVILAWEKVLLPPFFSWVDKRYPGEANRELRGKIQQRIEHFFISIAVDVVVVTLLLRVVRRQQRKVSESEERYRALFEHANDGIGVARADDYRLLEANGKFCEITGCEPNEIARHNLREILLGRDGAQAGAVVGLLGGAQAGEGELNIRTCAGEERPVSVSFSTLPGEGDKLVMFILRDLSPRKRFEAEKAEMERQLFQSSKLASIGELSAGVAHEINNPLNGIINFAQLLKDENVERPEFDQQMIDGIIDEGSRIAQIVRGLLTFARHDTPELRPVSVADAVNTSVSLFGRQLEKDRISIEIELEKDLPPVYGDGSRLRQVIINMISNARHALNDKGAGIGGKSNGDGDSGEGEPKVFRIKARHIAGAETGVGVGHGAVRLEFYDNGVGIRRADMSKVFDPFFTTRRDSGGTGLGLSISFGIVRELGGTIKVESEEGNFTRFVAELPAAAWEVEYV
jgi:PAS domain S-box-containing protein